MSAPPATEGSEAHLTLGRRGRGVRRRLAARASRWLSARPRDVADRTARWPLIIVGTAGLLVATAALVWLGYVATRESTNRANQLRERRANEALALVRAALSADMKGVWTTAIVPFSAESFDEDPPYDLLHVSARAFARFPYPESFVLWKRGGDQHGLMYAFNRADRPPAWDATPPSADPFPVALVRQPAALSGLVAAVTSQAAPQSHYAVIEVPVNGVPYQVVAHVLFAPTKPYALQGFFAFTVNLEWLRTEYFAPLLAQVGKIGGDEGLSMAVTDEAGQVVGSLGPEPTGTSSLRTRFPLVFIDAALARSISPRLNIREWTASVGSGPDSTLMATLDGARRIFVLMAVAAGVSVLALLLTVKADRASLALASMKSDFVAGVTHELKTPVALIRLVGETLANGRYKSEATVQDYAAILSEQASRLSASIDNLLTYARYSGSPNESAIEVAPVEPAELIEGALKSNRPALDTLQFSLAVDVPADLPLVLVDRAAIVQVINNIIDNTVKYSRERRELTIRGRRSGRHLVLTFADRGCGIRREDIGHVFERFFRGRNASASGSGLGLAIAQRIATQHGGRVTIDSELDVGTEVTLALPTAGAT